MTVNICIRCDNAAFEDDPTIEVARLLRKLAARIEGHPHFSPGHSQPIMDINGNNVGDVDVLGDDLEVVLRKCAKRV